MTESRLAEALDWFIEPYVDDVYLMSRDQYERVPDEILANIISALGTLTVYETRERAYLATQALILSGMRAEWGRAVARRMSLSIVNQEGSRVRT